MENRLSSLSYQDGAGAQYHTDFQYLRQILVWKRTTKNGAPFEEHHYSYDGDLPAQDQDVVNHVTNQYAYGEGLPGGIGGLVNLNQNGAAYSYLYDGKGNVKALLDGAGSVAQTYQYDPFGVPIMKTNVFLNQPMRFSTKPYDEQTGLSYYGYRYYAPALGRWLTRDPLGEKGGLNLYGFVGNNPVNKIDPWGLTTYRECFNKCMQTWHPLEEVLICGAICMAFPTSPACLVCTSYWAATVLHCHAACDKNPCYYDRK